MAVSRFLFLGVSLLLLMTGTSAAAENKSDATLAADVRDFTGR